MLLLSTHSWANRPHQSVSTTSRHASLRVFCQPVQHDS